MSAPICFSVFSSDLSHIQEIYATDFEDAIAKFVDDYDGEDFINTKLVFVDFANGRSLVFKVKTSISIEAF